MKKGLSVLLIVAMLICYLSACGENDPGKEGGKKKDNEFPEIEVTETNLVNLIGKPLADAKKVFGKDYYAAQAVKYNGEEQTGYTYSFGDEVYAIVLVRDIKGEKIIYSISINGENADKIIKDSNVSIFGNIMLEDLTPEIAEHYKDKFFKDQTSKFNMTTIKRAESVDDMAVISCTDGNVNIRWKGSSKDGKLASVSITNSILTSDTKEDPNDPNPQKLPLQFSDNADRSVYPELVSLMNKTPEEIKNIFGNPGSNSYYSQGEGQYDYLTENSDLDFGFLEGKTDRVGYSSKNGNDKLKIVGNITFSSNVQQIRSILPSGYTLTKQDSSNPGETVYHLRSDKSLVILIWNNSYGRTNSETQAPSTIIIY